MTPDECDLNPDLEVVAGNKARWNTPEHRRRAFHGLGAVARYSMSFRAARIARLEKDIDLSISTRDDVLRLTALPAFSAMVVAKPGRILFERFAPISPRRRTTASSRSPRPWCI